MSTFAVTYSAGPQRVDACEMFDRPMMQTAPARERRGLCGAVANVEPVRRLNSNERSQGSAMNTNRMHAEIDAAYARRAYTAGYLDARDGYPACPPTGATTSMYVAEYAKGFADGSLARTMAAMKAVGVAFVVEVV